MGVKERQVMSDRIWTFYQQNDLKSTVRHFAAEGEKPNTIRLIIRRCLRTGTSVFAPKTGRKRSVATPEVVKRVSKKLVNKNMSERVVAVEEDISSGTVHNIKKRLDIKTRKCRKIPKMDPKQQIKAKTNARKLRKKLANKVVVMDDETCDG